MRSLLLGCALGLVLVACGGDETSGSGSGSPSSAATGGNGGSSTAASGGSSRSGSDSGGSSSGGSSSGGSEMGGSSSGGSSSGGSGMAGSGGNGGAGGGNAMAMKIYLAPDGDDTSDGSSPNASILTLNRAQQIVGAAAANQDVEIRIAPGIYYNQSVVWTFTMANHTITFMPLNDDGVRPVFEACKDTDPSDCQSWWFRLNVQDGNPTNIHFEYIRVEHYLEGISFNGNRDDFAKSNSHNRIYGCYFYQMGNKHHPSSDNAYAVVRLKNSDYNLVRNNHFVECENTNGAGLLHALYLAHNADHNEIRKNRFYVQSGDAVRLRDYSNDNDIEENTFIKVGNNAGYTDWYCTGVNCTKPTPECPSWDNEFRDNVLDGDYGCAEMSTWELFQSDDAAGCTTPTMSSVRLATSGNTKTATPCEML